MNDSKVTHLHIVHHNFKKAEDPLVLKLKRRVADHGHNCGILWTFNSKTGHVTFGGEGRDQMTKEAINKLISQLLELSNTLSS